MSNDTRKTEQVGLRLPPQLIEKIDERTKITGQSRQDVIRQAVINDLFQSC